MKKNQNSCVFFILIIIAKKNLQGLYIFFIFKKIGIICRRAYKPVYATISGEK
jgi:hypothetical protein